MPVKRNPSSNQEVKSLCQKELRHSDPKCHWRYLICPGHVYDGCCQSGTVGPGVVTGCTGMVVLLVMLLIRRKMAGKPVLVKLTAKTVAVTVLGMAGTLTLGAGMCMVMVWDMLVYGIVIGLVGIVLLMCLIPLVKGLQ